MNKPASSVPEQTSAESGAPLETPAASASKPPRKSLLSTFAALRKRNYRLYWFGQMISLIGTNMQTIGQAWLVLELTHSPLQLGLVGAVQFLPVLFFALIGGVFADRWPKRRALLFTQSAAMIQAFTLYILVATNTVQIWQVYVLALLLGITTSLDQPMRSAFVVEMVGREDLPNAVALNSSLTNLVRFVGPALGGVLIAVSGVGLLFLLNALSFIAVILALALIDRRQLFSPAAKPARQSTWQSLKEGMRYVWQAAAVSWVILVVGLVLLFGANFSVFLPLFATGVLHAGATGFGFLSAANGVGALLAALWVAWRNQQPTVRGIIVGTFIFTVLEIGFALSRIYPLSLVLIAGIGIAETIFGAQAITMIQTVAPGYLRGRVNSVYIVFFTGSIPLGYLLAGWLSNLVGASLALLICAALCLLTVGAGWLWRRPAEKDETAAPISR